MEASLWTRCMGALEAELPEQQFNTWVRPLQAMEGNGALKLLAPNRFVVDWINANLLPRIGELLRDESTGDVPIVTVEVGSRSTPLRAAAAVAASVAPRARRAEGAGGRSAPESGFHLRQLRRGQEQPARQSGGPAGGGEPGPRLQPAVPLRRRGPRQDAPDALDRAPHQAQRRRKRASPTCIPSASSATWCAPCNTTR